MSQDVSISIKLIARNYKLKVAVTNEATVRTIAQNINEKVNDLKKQFPGRDDQDYLAMAFIDFVTSQQAIVQNTDSSNELLLTELQSIDQLLDA